jgi:hypothetical protein
MKDLTRRDFMSTSLKGGVLAAIASRIDLKAVVETPGAEAAQVAEAVQVAEAAAGPLKFFDADQAAIVKAATSVILPSDSAPGANEVNTVGYIDEAVSKSDSLKKLYTLGLQGMDDSAQVTFGKKFVDLTSEQQLHVLRLMQAGVVAAIPWNLVSPTELFNNLRDSTIFSFYINPIVFPSLKWPGPAANIKGWPDWAGPER